MKNPLPDAAGQVGGYDFYPNTRTVDAYVLRLRPKLKPEDGGDGYFHTVHGVGYCFMPEDDSLVINRDANQPQRNFKGIRGTNKDKDTPRVFPRGKGCLNLRKSMREDREPEPGRNRGRAILFHGADGGVCDAITLLATRPWRRFSLHQPHLH